jgi:1,4-alpha-glucan branching enzyme
MHCNFEDDIQRLVDQNHDDPHSFLGLQMLAEDQAELRFWQPNSQEFYFHFKGQKIKAPRVADSGLFTYPVPPSTSYKDYRVIDCFDRSHFDPYNFNSCLTSSDKDLIKRGLHYNLYDVLGSKFRVHQGVRGVSFCVWAPNARGVSVVGDFNQWQSRIHIMRKSDVGVFEIFIPGLELSEHYKYEIMGYDKESYLKIDPFAHSFEMRPKHASLLANPDNFCFRDYEWMQARAKKNHMASPMLIYEVHLGSWLKRSSREIGYKELASELVHYCKDMGYTHIELLPVTEHPLDESWGYEVTGFFASTTRHGSLEDFQYFVNHLHMHNIGIILDWVPGHFPKDQHALIQFDGSRCYEKEDVLMGEHPEWGTMIFDYAKPQVTNFLIASALFWVEKMHIDGLRVDAVQSMLYLDYARDEGEYKKNAKGGCENLEAIEFIKHLNSILKKRHPSVLLFAEDASLYPKVTEPVEWQGLGFDLKWNLGWMRDMLDFFALDPINRKNHHKKMVSVYNRAYDERYILCLSHDEVVHEKGSFYDKMARAGSDPFQQMPLFYSMAICHPGKKLFFMGIEIGQKKEWCVKGSLEWDLLEDHKHIKFKRFVKRINHFYLKNPALFERDVDEKGFKWVDHSDDNHSIISFMRRGVAQELLVVHNMTPTAHKEYRIALTAVRKIKQVFASDEDYSMGQEIGIAGDCVTIAIQPLSTTIFEVEFADNEL